MQEKICLLFTANLDFIPNLKKVLSEDFNLVYENRPDAYKTIRILKENRPEYWICNPAPGFIIDKKFMAYGLKSIITPSTGTSHISLSDAKRFKVGIYSLLNTESVHKIRASSEFTFLLLMSMFRNLKQLALNKNLKEWRASEDQFRGWELHGKNVGIVGFGRNGRLISQYCLAFGMNVFYFDPYVQTQINKVKKSKNLIKMAGSVDALVVTASSNQYTRNLISKEVLSALKINGVFINTSRGEVVNQKDLIKEIKKNNKFFALDVVSHEEKFTGESLTLLELNKTHNNLFITPHIAGLTFDSETKAQELAVSLLKDIINGRHMVK
jgi:phosphoglycerate dehydrogenase-like enzyme